VSDWHQLGLVALVAFGALGVLAALVVLLGIFTLVVGNGP
jgi:hypothetical protein